MVAVNRKANRTKRCKRRA